MLGLQGSYYEHDTLSRNLNYNLESRCERVHALTAGAYPFRELRAENTLVGVIGTNE